MERERKLKRAKEREKTVSPRFFPALSLALFFARAPLSERLEQANIFIEEPLIPCNSNHVQSGKIVDSYNRYQPNGD